MGQWHLPTSLSMLVSVVFGCVPVLAADAPEIRQFPGKQAGQTVACAIYPPRPIPDGKAGLVIHLYGSGGSHTEFNAGTPSYDKFRETLAQRGCWLVVPELGKRHWMSDAACDSVDAVIAAMVEKEQVDPARVSLLGTSMGGGSSLIYVMKRPGKIRSVCAVFPMTDFEKWLQERPGYRPSFEEAHHVTPETRQELLRKFSPIDHVAAFERTRVFLLHGDKDSVVPSYHSRDFAAKLKEQGFAVTYREAAGETHRDEIAAPYQREMADFLTGESP